MAAEELEAAQKALRKTDYEESDDEDELITEVPLVPTETRTAQTPLHKRGPMNDKPASLSFDPYAEENMDSKQPPPPRDSALFDDASVHSISNSTIDFTNDTKTTRSIPGAAGYLEMEEEPPRDIPIPISTVDEEIRTSSGLLLTHRRPSPTARRPEPTSGWTPESPNPRLKTVFDKTDPHARGGKDFRKAQRDYFELEHGFMAWKSATFNATSAKNGKPHSMHMLQARRFLSYVRIWMVVSAVFLLIATGVLFHSFGHHEPESVVKKDSSTGTSSVQNQAAINGAGASASSAVLNAQQIILMPMENVSELSRQKQQEQKESPMGIGYHTHHYQPQGHQAAYHGARRALLSLREEFEEWVTHHGKQYHSVEEKENRFNIWSQNHQRTIEKNMKHGPCKMTKQSVFGSNHFKDLSPDEFKAKFLTGFKRPSDDEVETQRRRMSPKMRSHASNQGKTLKPGIHNAKMHESIKQRLLDQQLLTLRNPNCRFFDISCLLRWLWNAFGVQFGSIVGTMEPRYDSNAFPNSVDWREYGVVTEVRSQGDCGACWAITAVETVESAHAIATGNLYDLSETEIITCDDSCEMCSGGWPQNAYEWVMEHGGLPLYNSMPYDATTLLYMTEGIEGSSATWTEDMVKDYRSQVCPADDDGSKSHDSEDSYWSDTGADNNKYGDYSDKGRYGNIKGYGYATDRCVCYSDGSGCSCSDQDEELAVANVATYGPAVVCIEASLWQDYAGGIITSELGCGSEFLDMNHCVQVVGYAFTDGNDGGDDRDLSEDSKDHSEDDAGSSGGREGYWIVRNQWGGYWGMNGYAYVAMGGNTCGILNDMTQAYLDD